MDRFKKVINKIGAKVYIENPNKKREGVAIFYPVRYQRKGSGNIAHTSEGHTDGGRFMVFAETNLLDGAEYGDIISDNKNKYMILWADIYSFKSESYAKACVKLVTDRGVTD